MFVRNANKQSREFFGTENSISLPLLFCQSGRFERVASTSLRRTFYFLLICCLQILRKSLNGECDEWKISARRELNGIESIHIVHQSNYVRQMKMWLCGKNIDRFASTTEWIKTIGTTIQYDGGHKWRNHRHMLTSTPHRNSSEQYRKKKIFTSIKPFPTKPQPNTDRYSNKQSQHMRWHGLAEVLNSPLLSQIQSHYF